MICFHHEGIQKRFVEKYNTHSRREKEEESIGGRGCTCKGKHLPHPTLLLLSRLPCVLYERTNHAVLLVRLEVIHDQQVKICNHKSNYYVHKMSTNK